ncbi:serine hydrolase [Streptomyces sp. B15]|uniref:serine hydrolase n=1 Tax=Streptomyces sp. B15 TaxID=1537797 RepID=UPI0027DCED67|nr:serine hydrolase [Streptomyces sp. B15]
MTRITQPEDEPGTAEASTGPVRPDVDTDTDIGTDTETEIGTDTETEIGTEIGTETGTGTGAEERALSEHIRDADTEGPDADGPDADDTDTDDPDTDVPGDDVPGVDDKEWTEDRTLEEPHEAPQATSTAPREPSSASALDPAPAPGTTPPEVTAGRRLDIRSPRVWVAVALVLGLVLAAVQTVRPLPAPDAAHASYTVPGHFAMPWPGEGQAAVTLPGTGVVGTHGRQRPVPTASVAKVMTAYVLLTERPLRKGEEGPMIEVDAKAVEEGRSKHESRIEGLTAGQKFSQRDMLKMLMIPSGNNIARLLARWVTDSRTEATFVRKMNAAARKLGMKDTTYTDPSGLDAATVSTAVDQLKLAEAVMRFDAFRAVVALPSATVDGLDEPLINNMDKLLMSELSIRGIKTGSNTPAGGTLVWAAYKTVGDRTPLILGTMLDQHFDGADPNGADSLTLVKDNSKKIVRAIRASLTSATAVRKGRVVGYLDDGLGGRTPLVTEEDFTVVGVPGQRVELRVTARGAPLPRSAKAGTEVGFLTAGSGPDAVKVPVTLRNELSSPSFMAKLTRWS